MHPPAYRPKLSMMQSRQFNKKNSITHQQPLFTAILSRAHHAPATLQVYLPSSFVVISRSRAAESSALLMEISIASADAESSSLSSFPSIYSSQTLSSHKIKIREEGYSFFTYA